jgi:hypothetical protein
VRTGGKSVDSFVSHKFFTKVKVMMTSVLIRQSTEFEAQNSARSEALRQSEAMTKIRGGLKAQAAIL